MIHSRDNIQYILTVHEIHYCCGTSSGSQEHESGDIRDVGGVLLERNTSDGINRMARILSARGVLA